MDVPYFTYDYLKDQAAAVLSRSKYATRFPVEIELIVEQDFKMDVVPIRGLQGSFNIDAFISSDMSTISVDEFVLENRLNRYRSRLRMNLVIECCIQKYFNRWILTRLLIGSHRSPNSPNVLMVFWSIKQIRLRIACWFPAKNSMSNSIRQYIGSKALGLAQQNSLMNAWMQSQRN